MLERKESELAIYLAKRLLGACVVLWAIITITFGLMHAIPGGPFTQEKKLPPAVMATVEARYHLDEPLWPQYADYVRHAAVLDLGPSYKYPGKTVNDIIAETFPVSAQLGLISLLLAIGAGVLAGMAAAWYKNTWIDYAMMIGATLGVSVPSFILAAVLIQLFAFTWPVLPAALWKGPAYVILPALALAAQPTAFIMRLTRSSLLDALGQDYIRTARSRGIGMRSLICRHASWFEDNHEQDDIEQHGNRIEDVDNVHHDLVRPAASQAGNATVEDADKDVDQAGHEADGQGNAGAIEDAD